MKHEKKDGRFPVIDLPDEFLLHPEISDEDMVSYQFPHRLRTGCFVVLLGGSCKFSINLCDYTVDTRSIITILPKNIVHIVSQSDDCDYCLMSFPSNLMKDKDLAKSLLSRAIMMEQQPVLGLDDNEFSFIYDFFNLFAKSYSRLRSTNQLNNAILSSLQMSFFYGICSIYDKKYPTLTNKSYSRKEQITKDFLYLVFQYYHSERNVSFYADKLCITPKYLNMVIRQVKGMTASQIISYAVIMEAKSRLKSTNDTVQQISQALNFPNQSFFSKYFKRIVGKTPKEFADS